MKKPYERNLPGLCFCPRAARMEQGCSLDDSANPKPAGPWVCFVNYMGSCVPMAIRGQKKKERERVKDRI